MTVVMLPIGDISTLHWQFAMEKASEIRCLPRVKFTGPDSSPDFQSALYIFRPVHYRKIGGANVTFWDYR